jgi:integrase/recombinase XerD
LLLLLARLGLRASDIASLRLRDIDWSGGRLQVTGKSRRTAWLPLPQEVGDALLHYLRTARPAVGERGGNS